MTISQSLDPQAQTLELPYSTNGTPKIVDVIGEFISATVVGEEVEETEATATETAGAIQIEVSRNTGLLRKGSVAITLAENDAIQCTVNISQSGGGLTE